MKNQEIIMLIGQKRAYNSSSFLLRIGENIVNSPKNIAILASKKNFKTAVLRNTVRRLVKNAVNKAFFEIANDKKINVREVRLQINRNSFIFSPKKGFEGVVFSDLVEEIKQSFINNGII